MVRAASHSEQILVYFQRALIARLKSFSRSVWVKHRLKVRGGHQCFVNKEKTVISLNDRKVSKKFAPAHVIPSKYFVQL